MWYINTVMLSDILIRYLSHIYNIVLKRKYCRFFSCSILKTELYLALNKNFEEKYTFATVKGI